MNKISFDHAARTRASGVAGLAMVPLDSSSLQKVESREVSHIVLMLDAHMRGLYMRQTRLQDSVIPVSSS